ncbi:unnamed protein product [Amaranthus hypochondriacus]
MEFELCLASSTPVLQPKSLNPNNGVFDFKVRSPTNKSMTGIRRIPSFPTVEPKSSKQNYPEPYFLHFPFRRSFGHPHWVLNRLTAVTKLGADDSDRRHGSECISKFR